MPFFLSFRCPALFFCSLARFLAFFCCHPPFLFLFFLFLLLFPLFYSSLSAVRPVLSELLTTDGLPHAQYNFRLQALDGSLPGVRKASW